MKKYIFALLVSLVGLTIFVAGGAEAAVSPRTIISQSIDVLKNFAKQNDIRSMAELVDNGHGVAIVPELSKAGFIIGGQHGYGLILARKGKQWFGPSFFEMSGGSIGFQIGIQTVSLLFCINNQAGMKAFTDNKSKLGANIGIAAGPVGREAGAATDGGLKASIYSYSMSQGLYAGVNIDGSAIGASKKMNNDYWGKKFTIEQALSQRANKPYVKELIAELERIIKRK